MLLVLECTTFAPGYCPFWSPSADYLDFEKYFFTLATLGLSISPLPQYPRSSLYPGFFKSPWDNRAPQPSPKTPTGTQHRWRREGGGVPQEEYPWWRLGDQPHEEAHKYMSRPSDIEDRPAGTQDPISLVSGTSAESSRPSTASAVRTEAYGGYGGYGGTFPGRPVTDVEGGSSSRRPSAESTAQTPSRALGVHSILNPSADPEEREPFGFRPAGRPAMSLAQGLLPAPAESPRSRKRTDPRSPPREYEHPPSARTGRRVLTPKSPAVRAASLGARRHPTFHSTMQPIQPGSGATGRTYIAEPGPYRTSEIPPLPPLSIATGSNLSNLASLESGHPRSAQVPESPARALEPTLTPQTERASTSQTPYSKIEQPSPVFRHGHGLGQPHTQPPTAFRVLPAGIGGFGHETQMHGPHEGYQSGPASYQMTLDTDQGPMVVPVELDLQQASKVADEKRKRNAGASARFRARRKEKEKEASQTISGLQQELRDLIDERDFYLAERNYFRDLATRHVPSTQLLQRPPSPQQRRLTAVATAPPGGSSENTTISSEAYRERSDSGSTVQRRRTGDYEPTFIGRQTHSPPGTAYGPGFPSQPPLPLPPPPTGPSSYGPPRTLPPGPPLSLTRSQSYDPFRRDAFDRSWSSAR